MVCKGGMEKLSEKKRVHDHERKGAGPVYYYQ